MGCRGVYFALTADEEKRLLSAGSDEAVLEIIQEEIEERWDEKWAEETDKSWDAMHRCLTDGTLSFEPVSALHQCVLGGKQLYGDDDYIVSFLTAEETRAVAAAIRDIDQGWMREKYFRIDPEDYEFPTTEEDFDYTWEYFQSVKRFFQKAAKAGRAVIFTVDQ